MQEFSSKDFESKFLSWSEIVSLAKDILKEWWVIVLVAMSASMIAEVVVKSNYVPQYTTKSTFVVTSKATNSNVIDNISSAHEMATKFSEILNSTVLKKTVANEIGLDSFDAKMKISVISETNLMELTVTADNAKDAFNIICSVMNNYNKVSDYIIADVILEVLQPPKIPTGPSNYYNSYSVKENAKRIAAVLMIVLIGIISYYKDTIKGEKDVSEKIDAKLLGTIYHERKFKSFRSLKNLNRVSMTIKNPMHSFRYLESNKLMASKVRRKMDQKNAKIIAVTSVTENEGKSTVAANLALAMAEEKKKVLLIDCDFRKPAQYKVFDLNPKKLVDFNEIMTGKRSVKDFIYPVDKTLYGIFNISTNMHMFENGEGKILKAILNQLKEQVDYIIIDTSPIGLVAETEEVTNMADVSLLVVRHDYVRTRDINDAIDALNKTKGKVLGCVLNDMSSILAIGSSYGYSRSYGYGGHYGKRTE